MVRRRHACVTLVAVLAIVHALVELIGAGRTTLANATTRPAKIQSSAARLKVLDRQGSPAVLVSLQKGYQMLVHGEVDPSEASGSIVRHRDYGRKTAAFLEAAVAERKAERQARGRARAPPPVACLDFGAHVGFHAINLARKGAAVLAWECDPQSQRLLRVNLRLANVTDRVRVFSSAASDRPGRAVLSLLPGSPAASSIGVASQLPWRATPAVEVRVTRVLDDLRLANVSSVAAIKLDVSGHEIEVLRGLGPLRALGVTHVAADFSPQLLRANGHEPASLITMLRTQGFVVSRSWPKVSAIEDPEGFARRVERQKGAHHQHLYCVRDM